MGSAKAFPAEGPDTVMSSAAQEFSAQDVQTLTHDGLLYRSQADYLAGVLPFIDAGIAADQPVLVAVPEPNLDLLRRAVAGSPMVEFADMMSLGRNPARILPSIHRFLDAYPLLRVRVVGEPIWPGRTAAEICEATRHEAMLNTAFADAAIDILCPYNINHLQPAAIADAWRTHPFVLDHDQRHPSPNYTDPLRIYAGDDPLVPDPPDGVQVVAIGADDLPSVRQFIRQAAAELGLDPRRTHDLVLAVNEITTNTVLHTPGTGTLRIWSEPCAVICEIRDQGFIGDAFAGRRAPNDAADHGRGLWMANQLCDLVQLRSTERGTTIRVHMDRLVS